MTVNGILYIGGFDLPDKNAASQRVISNAKLFRALGYNVFLVGLSRQQQKRERIFVEGFQGINLKYPQSIVEWYEYLFSIKQYLPFINEECRYVIAYNHPAVALDSLSRYCHKKNIKVIADSTEWYEPQGNAAFRIIKGWDTNRRMYKSHLKMDGIIPISNYLEEFYRNRGMKTLLLPPLVDIEEGKWSDEHDNISDGIRLIYAGSTNRKKDRIDIIIEALGKVFGSTNNKLFFDILGLTEEQYFKMYPEQQKEMLPDFVRFHGRVSHNEVIKQLRQSDFQIFLRENNLVNTAGFPTKFTESISVGVLVLTNLSSDLGKYMREGENGYCVDNSNLDTLVHTLVKPLSLSRAEIEHKKLAMKRDVFDYRNYLGVAKTFIESL